VDEGRVEDAAFFDFNKAFEMVSCSILISKIEQKLKCRQVDCSLGRKVGGTILGAFLFNIFINNLEEEMKFTSSNL